MGKYLWNYFLSLFLFLIIFPFYNLIVFLMCYVFSLACAGFKPAAYVVHPFLLIGFGLPPQT